ncbi:MAG: UbiA family prenyltransferase [Vicinamibacteria bacterium]
MSSEGFARVPAALGVARAWRVLRASLRLDEVLVLQGAPLLGALLAMGPPRVTMLPALALFTLGSCCLVAHVFLLNDWAGTESDRRDPNRACAVPRRTLGHLSIVALLLTLLLLAPFGPGIVATGLAIAGLSALYSLRPWAAKGVPVLGSLVHLTGGVLHFHLGYALFAAPGGRSLALSAFFALTFAAGHLMQEVGDHDADRLNGIRTNAVAFGRTAAFVAGLALFAVADAVLVWMAVRGVVPRSLVAVAALFALHLGWSLRTLRAGLTFEGIRRLRRRYRWLYAVVGLSMVAAAFAG